MVGIFVHNEGNLRANLSMANVISCKPNKFCVKYTERKMQQPTNEGKNMNAVEFQATVHNGVITLPSDQKSWNGKKIKVILLDEASPGSTEKAADESTSETDFFDCAGIWENRDINQESIRAKAWRTNRQ